MDKQAFSMLQSDKAAVVQRVYADVICERWFDRNFLNDLDFAKIVVRAMQDGITNELILKRYAATIAKQRFSRSEVT